MALGAAYGLAFGRANRAIARCRVRALRFVDLEPGDRRLTEDLLPVLAELRA
jgi:hypothetical protein